MKIYLSCFLILICLFAHAIEHPSIERANSLSMKECELNTGATFENCPFAFAVINLSKACNDISAPAPVIIVNSTCSNCALSGGSITAPVSPCAEGTILQFKVDNGSWTDVLPTYNQMTSQTIYTRCSCEENSEIFSDSSNITTIPGVCTPPDATITLTENAGPGGLNDAVICSGNPIMLSASGGGTYLWSTLATTSTITVSPGGSSVTYTVTVTAPNGCTSTGSQTLTILPNPTGSISVTENSGTPDDGTVCAGTQVTLAAPGGFSYSWSTNLATTSSVTIIPSNSTYRVSVTDGNNCRSVFIKPIVVLNNPNVIESLTHPICGDLSVGAIDLTVSSGTAPYTFVWSDGSATTEDRTGLGAGMYTVTVADASGCTISATYTLNPPSCCPDLSVQAPANVIIVNSSCTIGASPSGGLITAPGGTPCPTGSTLQYQVNGGLWSNILPIYDQEGPAQTVKTRCSCDEVPTTVSAESEAISTEPVMLSTFYADTDSDGFGDPLSDNSSYCQPLGYVTNNTDCDDNDALEYPGQTWYADLDNDGYSNETTVIQCLRPAGHKVASELLAISGDCNDISASINPDAAEICDGVDNNCDGESDEGVTTRYYYDLDGDGYGEVFAFIDACAPSGLYTATLIGDCVADDADIYPGATEICDGKDNDCNGQIDEGVTIRYYYDFDGDGYGEASSYIDACTPSGLFTAALIGDCVADDADIYPGATEICDGKDNDCNGQIDEGFITRYFYDEDGDGYGQNLEFIDACAPVGLYNATVGGDCNDSDMNINPGAIEVCNDIDDNCDGTNDEGFPIVRYYFDSDGDGFGESGAFRDICGPLGFYTATVAGDCNNSDNTIYPNAPEICDGLDNDCNGQTDEGVLTTYYADGDEDGFGDPSNTTQACSLPAGYVNNNTDCNDNDALEFPGQIWYADLDNDGYSNETTLIQCLRPAGYKVTSELIDISGDCNDNNTAINPFATEICDGIDNNCDGETDEGVLTTYYADEDEDGFGDPSNTTQACSAPAGYVTNNTDCDDTDALEFPGQIWLADLDNDGYSSGTTLVQCLRPAGYKVASELLTISGDCNDNSASINPDAAEICDGVDNDCDGESDEGVTTRYYYDLDGDGYGEVFAFIDACAPSGLYNTTLSGDCVADDSYIYPGATEICDGKDNDCNGQIDEGVTIRYYYDFDGDGYGEASSYIDACTPSGLFTATLIGDCVADDADIYPGATEICDGKDNDCNGQIDEGFVTRYFYDEDGDGYGQSVLFIDACAPVGLYTAAVGGDCNDSDMNVNPGAIEVCNDIDDNCDGTNDEGFPIVRYYFDSDGDGFGESGAFRDICGPLGFYTATVGGDCNNSDNTIYPNAPEICDGIDNDCNGQTDEGVLTTYYADEDEDGFGDPSNTTQACSLPAGYVNNNTDCNDNDALEFPDQTWYADLDNDGYSSGTTLVQCLRPAGYKVASELLTISGDCNDNDAAINPDAAEICDGMDNNCNGLVDSADPYYQDAIAPEIVCPTTQYLFLSENCAALIPDFKGLALAADNCGFVQVFQSVSLDSLVTNAGQIEVQLIAQDAKLNESSCTFNLIILDTILPLLTCINQEIFLNGEESVQLQDMDLVSASDNCAIESVQLNPSLVSNSQAGEVIPVLVTVTDINGNKSTCTSQVSVSGLPQGWSHSDGDSGCDGPTSVSYLVDDQQFVLSSTNCFNSSPFTLDEMAVVNYTLCGDGSITAYVQNVTGELPGWAGIIMRESNAAGSKKVQLTTNRNSNQVMRSIRSVTNGMASQQSFPAQNRYWLRLVRQGNQFIGYTSQNGSQWFQSLVANVSMGTCIEMGLTLSNSNQNSTVQATFSNVVITGNNNTQPINPTGITFEKHNVVKTFEVFPNPSNGFLSVDLKDFIDTAVEISISNVQGQEIYYRKYDNIDSEKENIRLEHVIPGMYFISIKPKGETRIIKKVVLK